MATIRMDFDAMTGKKCCNCLAVKPFSEFWVCPRSQSGYVGRCKECSKRSVRRAEVRGVPPRCQVNAAWRQPKTCPQCGETFFAASKSHAGNKTCSDACKRSALVQWHREHGHERVWPVNPKADRKLQPSYRRKYTNNRTQHCLGQCLHCQQDIMGRRRNRVITFCSFACRVAHKSILGIVRICLHCKESFPVTDRRTYQRKTCSTECFIAYGRVLKLGKRVERKAPVCRLKFYNCIVCEKMYVVGSASPWRGKYCCSPDCIRKHLSQSRMMPPEKQVRIVCHWCQKESFRLPCSINQKRSNRVFCDRVCSGAWFSEQSQGDNWFTHRLGQKPLWNYGWSWKSSQGAALRRDHNSCRLCKRAEAEIGQKPDVHHVIPFASFGKARHLEANALSNLLCLCRSCHMSIEPKNYAKWRKAQSSGRKAQMSKELAHAISQIKTLRAIV